MHQPAAATGLDALDALDTFDVLGAGEDPAQDPA